MSVPLQNSSVSTTLISQNVISKNSIGISLYATKGATIVLNNITDNLDWGMRFDGNPKNNIIHHNNFMGNNVTDKLQVCITGFWKQMDNGSHANGAYVPPRRDFVAGETNFWNNTSGGNYWQDWRSPDDNGDGFVDMPYIIAGNMFGYGGGADQLPLADLPSAIPEFASPALVVAGVAIIIMLSGAARSRNKRHA